MEPINHRKKYLFGFLTVAIGTAGFLTYQKYEPTLQPASVNEVKGIEVTATNPYNESNFEKHMAMTPTNIVWFTNYYRNRAGIPPLRMQNSLNKSAHAKNSDMFVYDYFEHVRPDDDNEKGFEEFIDEQHYAFIKAGENLARGNFKTSKDVVDAWMASDGHRHNILDASYADIGVAVDENFITQHFALPQKYCPTVSDTTKSSIDRIRAEVGDLADDIEVMETEIAGMNQNDPAYNNRVTEYNTLVGTYNGFVNQLQELVGAYNEQVKKFDQCVKGIE